MLSRFAGYTSELESDAGSEIDHEEKKQNLDKDAELFSKPKPLLGERPKRRAFDEQVDAVNRKRQRFCFYTGNTAFDMHKTLVNNYLNVYGGSIKDFAGKKPIVRTDLDVIEENHKFIWEDDDNADTWGKQLAKKYYDKLFKEYCLADLSLYKENKIALRWRTEKEVIDGKGQFSCGNKRCPETKGLKSWEVNFAYLEESEKRNALVKVRLCPDCSYKLNFKHKRKEIIKKSKVPKDEAISDGETSTPLSKKDGPQMTIKAEPQTDTESVAEEEGVTYDSAGNIILSNDQSIWKTKPAVLDEKRNVDKEMDDFLSDMFM